MNSNFAQDLRNRFDITDRYIQSVAVSSYNKLTMPGDSRKDNGLFNGLVRDAIIRKKAEEAMQKKIDDEKRVAEENRGIFRLFG